MECISPLKLDNHNIVPCGRCLNCLQNRRKEWTFRLYHEHKKSYNGYFLTLTYGDDSLPISENQDGTYQIALSKEHVQKFIKNVRQRKVRLLDKYGDQLPDKSYTTNIKYFAVGEYGERTLRPHYHLLLFNLPTEMIPRDIDRAWKKGTIHAGTITQASIHYCTKYSLKADNWMLCSNGIGAEFLEKTRNYFIENNTDLAELNNYKQKLPRYYRDKLKYSNPNNYILNNRSVENMYLTGELDHYYIKKHELLEPRKRETQEYHNRLRKDRKYYTEVARLSQYKHYPDPEAELDKRIILKYEKLDKLFKDQQKTDLF